MIHKHFKTKAKFNEELAKTPSGVSDSDICFIKETGEIWTHGKFYAGSDALVSTVSYDTTNKKFTKTINGTTSDIVTVSKLKTDFELSKSDVGLDNVGNFKAVSTAASQGLSSTEQANARTNIGAGTSSFSGSYNDLSDKPSIPSAAANGAFSIKTKSGSSAAVTAAEFTANQNTNSGLTLIKGDNVTLTTDAGNNTITIAATDTTYSNATTSEAGLMSSSDKTKLDGIATGATANVGTITKVGNTSSGDVAVTSSNNSASFGSAVTVGTVGEVDLKFTMPANPNTHYTAIPVAGGSTATSNATSDTADPYINIVENSTKSGGIQIKGAGATSVNAANGVITVSSTNNNTTYTFGNGENGFTVTPSGGSAQNVTVTPSIDNNVTASGNFAADAIIVGNGASQVAKNSGKTISTTAPSSESEDTTVPTSKAVWTAIGNGIATNDAMVYKGTIAGGSTGSYGALTGAAGMGWTYKVSAAGKINGVSVEVGDMIICNTDNTAAATSSNYSTIAASWDVIQTNVDGALFKSSNSFTDDHVLVADSTAGKVKDSGFTIGKSVPSDAVFTDTDTKVTSVDNHYSPTANAGSELTASLSGTAGTFETNTEYTVLTGIKAQRDAKGHVTGLTYTAQKVKDTTIANTDRYVNSAAFADDTTGTPASPVKMTLTRAGSDSATVTGNIPKVSASSAGVAPKGAAVSTQSQSTKFLREDGTWAAPSYTTDTNTTYKLTIGDTTNGDTTNGVSLGTLQSKAAAANGTDLSLVTTGEKSTWNGKQDALVFNTAYNASTNKVATMSDINNAGFVTETVLENKELVVSSALNDLEIRKLNASDLPTAVSMFTNDAGYATTSSLTPKADKVTSATAGNLAGLDSNGNLVDSGSKPDDFVQNHGIDFFGTSIPAASAEYENKVGCLVSISGDSPMIGFGICRLVDGKYEWTPTGVLSFINSITGTSSSIPNEAAVVDYVTSQIPSTLPASDVYSWAKASSKPTYTASEVGIKTSLVSVTGNLSNVTCPDTLSNGQQSTVIYKNNGSAEYTVSVSTSNSYVTPDGQQLKLTCPVGGYCEVSYLKVGNTIFVRGV